MRKGGHGNHSASRHSLADAWGRLLCDEKVEHRRIAVNCRGKSVRDAGSTWFLDTEACRGMNAVLVLETHWEKVKDKVM